MWLSWFGGLKALALVREAHGLCPWEFLRGLLFCPLVSTVPAGLPRAAPPFPATAMGRLSRHLVQGDVRHFLLEFPLLLLFSHPCFVIKFSPMLCYPWSMQWNWPRLLGKRIPGLLTTCGDVISKP